MIINKTKIAFTVLLFSFSMLSAGEITLNDFLKGWLENDRDLKTAAISLEKAELSNEKSIIQNGFDITLSSGTMTFRTVNGNGKFTLNPSVKANLPATRNLSVNAGTDITISSDTKLENASISASLDLIDTDKEKRMLTEKKQLRTILEAKRQIEAKAQSSEKSFYSEIKSLLKSSESIASSKNSLYTDRISFEKIKTQGYAESSSNYRLAEMKVRNDLHSIETSERSLNHNFEMFLLKCGYSEDTSSYEDFLKLLDKEIPEQAILSFEDFKKYNYKQIENAIWNQEINSLSRLAEKNYTLKGSAGYTFNNTDTKDTDGKASDSIDAKLNSSVLGLNLSAGVSIPVNPSAAPAFSAGISFSPNTLKLQKLEEKEITLDVQSEKITYENAESNYNLALADNRQTVKDLEWNKTTIEENLSMYTKTEQDMKYYFDKGIITESEYLSAKSNKEKYEIEKTLSLLDIIITNCETQSQFYTE
ncbi:MAG: hypothetical protein MJ185_08125 [Treponema sp.]|nr:hypothetical protein [Treponema sp.]